MNNYAKSESSVKGQSVLESKNSGLIKFFCQTTRKGIVKKKKKQTKARVILRDDLLSSHQTRAKARSEKTLLTRK